MKIKMKNDDSNLYSLLVLLEFAGYVLTATREGTVSVSTNTGEYVATLADAMPSTWVSALNVIKRSGYESILSLLPPLKEE